jgi:HAD superfamily hydrolase (TIGR01484 family)
MPRSVDEAMKHLSAWPLEARRAVRGVFTDIDDTLTTEGAITDDALAALHALRDAGIPVITITGRAVGWCLPKIQAWPVVAMGAEAGAVLLLPPATGGDGQPQKRYPNDAATRARHQQRLREVSDQVLRAVPGLQIAPGADGRETDIAFDHNEHARLAPADLARVRQLLTDAGLTVAVSSIHIHGCVEPHDKFVGACWIVRELFGRDLHHELDRWVFVGDSANDEAMFRAFANTSVGVANVREGAGGLQHWPAWITDSPRGAGFAEVARALLAAR